VPTHTEPAARPGPVAKRLLHGAVAVFVLLAIGELAADALFGVRDAVRGADYRAGADALAGSPWRRRYFDELRAAQRAGWQPYVYWRERPFAGAFINIDERGIRRTWNRAECARDGASPPLVLMFGGSTMWGVGARDEYTIPSTLARRLAAGGGPPACVINFGEPGYVSAQELIALMLQIRDDSRPAVVVFYDGDNDAFAAYQEGAAGSPQNESHRRQEFNLAARPGEMLALTLERLAAQSGLYRAAESAHDAIFRRRRPADRDAPASAQTTMRPGLAGAVVAEYAHTVRVVESLAAAYRFRPLFYWQPLVWDKRRLTPYEGAEADRDAAFGRFWRQVASEVAASSELSNVPDFHNLERLFADRSEPLFIDFSHVSEQGNALVAERMAADVRAALAATDK
jgi:lysophospholipase L1-like esterase